MPGMQHLFALDMGILCGHYQITKGIWCCRGLGSLEGETWDAALSQVNSGDLLSSGIVAGHARVPWT